MKILEIVDEIEKERERQGLTVEELCKHAGVSTKTYSRWKARKSYATLAPLSCVMDVLNLEISITKRGQGSTQDSRRGLSAGDEVPTAGG